MDEADAIGHELLDRLWLGLVGEFRHLPDEQARRASLVSPAEAPQGKTPGSLDAAS